MSTDINISEVSVIEGLNNKADIDLKNTEALTSGGGVN